MASFSLAFAMMFGMFLSFGFSLVVESPHAFVELFCPFVQSIFFLTTNGSLFLGNVDAFFHKPIACRFDLFVFFVDFFHFFAELGMFKSSVVFAGRRGRRRFVAHILCVSRKAQRQRERQNSQPDTLLCGRCHICLHWLVRGSIEKA